MGQGQIVANPKDTNRSRSAPTMPLIVWIFFLLACNLPGVIHATDPVSASSSLVTTKTSSLPRVEQGTNSNNLHNILPVRFTQVSKAPNMTKNIRVTLDWGEKRSFELSNQDDYLRILSSLNAFSLKDYNGVEMVGFESLENTRSYTLGKKIFEHEMNDTDRFLNSIAGYIVGVLIYLFLL
jgi:hypothetical protein